MRSLRGRDKELTCEVQARGAESKRDEGNT